jgi:hypothetical protein
MSQSITTPVLPLLLLLLLLLLLTSLLHQARSLFRLYTRYYCPTSLHLLLIFASE